MSYCIISDKPVFLYPSRYKEIQERTLKGRDAAQQMASIVAGTQESQEAGAFVEEFLQKQHEADPVNFHTNWETFDITGEEAAREVWDLLTDYCGYYGYGYLSDLRNVAPQLADEDAEESQQYPVGRVFALNHFVKPARWWWPYTRKMKGRTVSLIIVAKDVYRLVGDLKHFTVFARNFRLNCGPNFGIYPVPKEKSPKQA